ncbi:MAG: hypothetical protein FJ125_00895 [Deltaproteobacteria bacterium]|nr:hypothetical protein [Deltaproteobacteria bacterium]
MRAKRLLIERDHPEEAEAAPWLQNLDLDLDRPAPCKVQVQVQDQASSRPLDRDATGCTHR